MNVRNNEIKEYDCLRVIATLLVVMGHCTYYKILTGFGGCDYSNIFKDSDICSRFLRELTNLIYTFHMPLFMGLSGALFRRTQEKGKYKSLKEIIIDKWKRLMIPFLLVSIFYAIPLKYISGYYQKSDDIIKDIVMGQVFLQGNSHLWYCATLFCIFIIAFQVETRLSVSARHKVILLSVLYFFGGIIDIHIVKYVFQYLLWFYLGYWFETKRGNFNRKISRRKIVVILLLFLTIYIIYKCLMTSNMFFIKLICKVWGMIVTVLACMIVYVVAYQLSRTSIVENKIFNMIREDSYGVYLYSDPWNYVIISVVANVFPDYMMGKMGILPLYIFRLLFTLGISVGITEMIRKLKIDYLY